MSSAWPFTMSVRDNWSCILQKRRSLGSYPANTKEEPQPLSANSCYERRPIATIRSQLSHAVPHLNLRGATCADKLQYTRVKPYKECTQNAYRGSSEGWPGGNVLATILYLLSFGAEQIFFFRGCLRQP